MSDRCRLWLLLSLEEIFLISEFRYSAIVKATNPKFHVCKNGWENNHSNSFFAALSDLILPPVGHQPSK